MTEMHSRLPGFTYSACGPFTRNKEKIQKFKETGDSRYIYQNELDKTWFQHDMAYGDFKNLIRRTASNNILHDKAFNTAKFPTYDDIKKVLLQWFINFLIKIIQAEQLKNQLKNYTNNWKIKKKMKIQSAFIDNISGTDLADLGFRYVIDIFSK